MGDETLHKAVWELVRRQHGVIARRQLVDLGFTDKAIKWRIARGRLHPVDRGVYAIGRPELTQEGRWMAALLRCGPDACLSHGSAAALWRIRREPPGPTQVSVPADVARRAPGIVVHRCRGLEATVHRGIPVTTPARTLLDLATVLGPRELEAALNEADAIDLVGPEALRRELRERRGQRGVRALGLILDRDTYRMTESELERQFLGIVRRAGLPLPDTQEQVAGRTDFHWPSLGLVVETDGWRYHRTPSRQARDNRRMQQHALAGRTAVRFSHHEIRHRARRVEAIIVALAGRLAA